MLNESNLHEYQRYAVDRIIRDPYLALLLDMGLGKTVSTLTALSYLIDHLEAVQVLVIAPLRVAQSTWDAEIKKWAHLQDLRVSKVLGTKDERLAALDTPADIYIINVDNVRWLVNHYGRTRWRFDTVIVDEFSQFKDSKSQRFKALYSRRKYIKRLVGLTGTPAPNGLDDLWSQMRLIDDGARLGRTKGEFYGRYFTPGARNGNVVYEWKVQEWAKKHIYKAIEDVAVSMKAKDYLDMPKLRINVLRVHMDAKERKQYDELKRELILEFEEGDVVAVNAGVLCGKLLQLANGSVYDENRLVQHIHDKKLDALESIIEEAAGAPVLVFYAFKHDLERIEKRLKRFKPVRVGGSDTIEAWNRGDIRVLLAHPASAGHGLNLQKGGSIIAWFGLTYSLEQDQQANARLYRQGQEKPVTIHYITADQTIDERVLKALRNKSVGQEELLSAVKAELNRG